MFDSYLGCQIRFQALVCAQYNTQKRKSGDKMGKAWEHLSREGCQVDVEGVVPNYKYVPTNVCVINLRVSFLPVKSSTCVNVWGLA